MKKWIAALLALTLVLLSALPAMAEQNVFTLEGFVTELVEGGFLMEDKALGEVLLNTDGQTVWDGALIDQPLEVGQYVFVDYDGKLTRSIPPQAHADKVGCYVLDGVAGEMTDDGVLLTGDEVFGEVLVHLDMIDEPVYEGVPLTVYYNGVMAMSLPGQVSASAVIVPCLEGKAGEPDELGFTLTTDDGQAYRVELDEVSRVSELREDVDAQDASIADAEEVSVDGDAATNDAEVEDALALSDIALGDRVKVYFGGEYLSDEEDAMLALEVVILR